MSRSQKLHRKFRQHKTVFISSGTQKGKDASDHQVTHMDTWRKATWSYPQREAFINFPRTRASG